MAVEKVGVYRKWLEPVPKGNDGKPIAGSRWTKERRHRWVVRWYGSNGKRYGKDFKIRKEADRYARELQSRVSVGRADKPKKITLREFVVEHGQVMKGQVAYATLQDQLRVLTLFEKFIGPSFLLASVKPRHAEAFVSYRLSTVPSVATVNKDIRTMRRIFSLAIEPRGYLVEGENPFGKIKERKTTENQIRYVSVEEYHRLIESTESAWWKTLLSIGYGSGLRRNEILNLTWMDIDFENQRIIVAAKKGREKILMWEPKGRKNRIVPISDESTRLLADMHAKAPEGHPYVFVSPERLYLIRSRQKVSHWNPRSQLINNLGRDFDAICHRTHVAKCTVHDLRRSAITNWAQRLPIQVVQVLAGHSSIVTTKKYYLVVRSEDLDSATQWVNIVLGHRGN